MLALSLVAAAHPASAEPTDVVTDRLFVLTVTVDDGTLDAEMHVNISWTAPAVGPVVEYLLFRDANLIASLDGQTYADVFQGYAATYWAVAILADGPPAVSNAGIAVISMGCDVECVFDLVDWVIGLVFDCPPFTAGLTFPFVGVHMECIDPTLASIFVLDAPEKAEEIAKAVACRFGGACQ